MAVDIFEGILMVEGISLDFGGLEWNQDLQKQALLKKETGYYSGKAPRPAAGAYQGSSHINQDITQTLIPSVLLRNYLLKSGIEE